MNRNFYGVIHGTLPAVMCDDRLGVLFANAAALRFAPALAWIASRQVTLPPSSEKALRETVKVGAGSVPVEWRVQNCRHHLLCRRLEAGGAAFYLLSFLGETEEPLSEFDAKRMLSACFAPRFEPCYRHVRFPAELFDEWFDSIAALMPDVTVEMLSPFDFSPVLLADEAISVVLTACASVAKQCGVPRRILIKSRKGGFSVDFCFAASLPLTLAEADSPALLAAAFRAALPQIVTALSVSAEAGYRLSASTVGTDVILSFSCDTYDIGELGFKANDEEFTNILLCLSAAKALLF